MIGCVLVRLNGVAQSAAKIPLGACLPVHMLPCGPIHVAGRGQELAVLGRHLKASDCADLQAFPFQAAGSTYLLGSAITHQDLAGRPGIAVEALSGDRAGKHGFRVNPGLRIRTRMEDGGQHAVEIANRIGPHNERKARFTVVLIGYLAYVVCCVQGYDTRVTHPWITVSTMTLELT